MFGIKRLWKRVCHPAQYRKEKEMSEEAQAQHAQFFNSVEALLRPPFQLEEVPLVFAEAAQSWAFLRPTESAEENYQKLHDFFYGADEGLGVLDRVVEKWKSAFGDAIEKWMIERALDMAFKAAGHALVKLAGKV